MTIRVVRGSAGDGNSDPVSRQKINNQNPSNSTQIGGLAASVAQNINSNDAVSVSVKTSVARATNSTPEKIKDSKQAKEVAEKIADDVKSEPSALEAHDGLNASSARAHFDVA
jgi:hypothetical protein